MTDYLNKLILLQNKILQLKQSQSSSSFKDLENLEILFATKGQNVEKTLNLIKATQELGFAKCLLGESRLDEAISKFANVNREKLEIHMIGHLQTNKAKQAFEFFDVIQTIDRENLAVMMQKLEQSTGHKKTYYIQVNIGDEPQKSGVAEKDADDFIKFCQNDLNLNVLGLMVLPPKNQDPRSFFVKTREIALKNKLKNLSMGMSADFEIAIEEGSSMIRVGSLIFDN